MAASRYEQLVLSPSLQGYNYSYYAVPSMWVLSMLPHWYGIYLTKGKFKNTNPRAYVSEITSKAQKTESDKLFLRCQAAQQNGHENLPFFAAGLIAANVAGVPTPELNLLAGLYLGSRLLYNAAFLTFKSEPLALLRSLIYLSGVGINFTLFIKAGLRTNSKL